MRCLKCNRDYDVVQPDPFDPEKRYFRCPICETVLGIDQAASDSDKTVLGQVDPYLLTPLVAERNTPPYYLQMFRRDLTLLLAAFYPNLNGFAVTRIAGRALLDYLNRPQRITAAETIPGYGQFLDELTAFLSPGQPSPAEPVIANAILTGQVAWADTADGILIAVATPQLVSLLGLEGDQYVVLRLIYEGEKGVRLERY